MRPRRAGSKQNFICAREGDRIDFTLETRTCFELKIGERRQRQKGGKRKVEGERERERERGRKKQRVFVGLRERLRGVNRLFVDFRWRDKIILCELISVNAGLKGFEYFCENF